MSTPTPSPAHISYHIDTAQRTAHLLQITLTYTAVEASHQLWLPTWIPGSYLIREFAKNISALAYRITSPNATTAWQRLNKHSKNSWRIDAPLNSTVEVRYLVYAFDLSVRGSYVDQFRAYINPASTLITVAGLEHHPIAVDLMVHALAERDTLATALPFSQLPHHWQLHANNYSELIDSPFELAAHSIGCFTACGINHRIYISGIHQTHMPRLEADLARICQAQINLFGKAPFEQYTFMTMATDNSYGGLEHQSCTSLICPRSDLPKINEAELPSEKYQRYLGLCSHEYFHAWLVKCIKPTAFMPYNLHNEALTDLLWVFEGFTSYYDDLMLYRCGAIGLDDYLKLLSSSITRHLQNPGRLVHSLRDASMDAWIKYYRPNEYSAQSEVSYYVGGAMFAFCLDAWLGSKRNSLDAVMRDMFALAQANQGISMDNLQHIIAQYLGAEQTAHIFSQFILQANELPLAEACDIIGLSLNQETHEWPLGIKLSETTTYPPTVLQVLAGSLAANAGISAADTLLAINHIKASKSALQDAHNHQEHLILHCLRRDELFTAEITDRSGDSAAKLYKATISAQSTTNVSKFFTRAGL